MKPFVKLKSPSTYIACDWDLSQDAWGREHWVTFFKKHVNTILSLGVAASSARGESIDAANARADGCRQEFYQVFDAYAANPTGSGRVTILVLDQWRDGLLRKHGFVDAFVDLKDRENEKMIPLVPVVCQQIDSLSGAEQVQALIEGVFAGNIFDMGAEATAKQFAMNSPDFFATRQQLAKRPWLFDDFDAVADKFLNKNYTRAVFFIDNAGSDFLLGALPLMRWLAQRDVHVVLAANERPTLNDMTIHDVNRWWPRIVEAEPSLKKLPIDRISTGTGEPLIDLLEVSDELNQASESADLVIIEGMGRGVESNLHAQFNCDALNLAMIKDLAVAKRHGGKVFDCVCRFR